MKHHKFIYEERCIWLYEYSLYWELPYLTLSILKGVFEQMKIQKKKKSRENKLSEKNEVRKISILYEQHIFYFKHLRSMNVINFKYNV